MTVAQMRAARARSATAKSAAGLRAAVPCHLQRPRRRTAREWVHEIKFDGYRIQARLDRRQGAAADPQAARLDRNGSDDRGRRGRRACRPIPRCSTARSGRSRMKTASADFSALQDRPEGRPARPLRLLRRSICSISMATI